MDLDARWNLPIGPLARRHIEVFGEPTMQAVWYRLGDSGELEHSVGTTSNVWDRIDEGSNALGVIYFGASADTYRWKFMVRDCDDTPSR